MKIPRIKQEVDFDQLAGRFMVHWDDLVQFHQAVKIRYAGTITGRFTKSEPESQEPKK